jgi:hypothetical protein
VNRPYLITLVAGGATQFGKESVTSILSLSRKGKETLNGKRTVNRKRPINGLPGVRPFSARDNPIEERRAFSVVSKISGTSHRVLTSCKNLKPVRDVAAPGFHQIT